MSLERLSDESIVRMYDNIRNEVAADIRTRVPQKLMGAAAKHRAEQLADEMKRRRIQFTLIDWPAS